MCPTRRRARGLGARRDVRRHDGGLREHVPRVGRHCCDARRDPRAARDVPAREAARGRVHPRVPAVAMGRSTVTRESFRHPILMRHVLSARPCSSSRTTHCSRRDMGLWRRRVVVKAPDPPRVTRRDTPAISLDSRGTRCTAASRARRPCPSPAARRWEEEGSERRRVLRVRSGRLNH